MGGYLFIDWRMAQWAILFHGNILFVGSVVTGLAGPRGGHVHQGAPSYDADGKTRRTTWAHAYPKNKIVVFKFV